MQDTKAKDRMPVNSRMTPSIKFAGTHLYTRVETGNVRVKCLVQENMCQAQQQSLHLDHLIPSWLH